MAQLSDALKGIARRNNVGITRRKIQDEYYQSTWSVVCIIGRHYHCRLSEVYHVKEPGWRTWP